VSALSGRKAKIVMEKAQPVSCAEFSVRLQYFGSLIGKHADNRAETVIDNDAIALALERDHGRAKLPLRYDPIAAAKFFIFVVIERSMNARRAFG
jgi:hypothetical protein